MVNVKLEAECNELWLMINIFRSPRMSAASDDETEDEFFDAEDHFADQVVILRYFTIFQHSFYFFWHAYCNVLFFWI